MNYRGEVEARAERIAALIAELEAMREQAKGDRAALDRIDAALGPRRAGHRRMLVVTALASIATAWCAMQACDSVTRRLDAPPDVRGDRVWLDGGQLVGTVSTVHGTGATAHGDRCRVSLEQQGERWLLRAWCGDALLYDDLVECTPAGNAIQTCIDHLGSSQSTSPRAYLDTYARLLRIEDGPIAAWSADIRLGELTTLPVSGSPTLFGDTEVPRGRAHTLRMSGPVHEIRGIREPDGFSVAIMGVLSLDRASPMVLENAAIERATMMNRGDHAVLTVRFVPGRTPLYQVVARGSAIDVTVER